MTAWGVLSPTPVDLWNDSKKKRFFGNLNPFGSRGEATRAAGQLNPVTGSLTLASSRHPPLRKGKVLYIRWVQIWAREIDD